MRPADLIRFLILATLWGASFLLIRIIVPSLGAIATTEARVALAGLALVAWHAIAHTPFVWRSNAKAIAVVGVINSAIPFALFAFAAKTLPAGYLAILNATSPLFGALVARAWLHEPLGAKRLIGVAFGIAGVAALVKLGPVVVDAAVLVACAACLLAAACYGFAGNYMRQLERPVPPTAMATGSQLVAAIALLPLLAFEPVHAMPTTGVIVAALILAIASTAIAFLLYFRLIRDVGATRALTVTFLIPLFAIGWARVVLEEGPTPRMASGAALVIVATWLIVSAQGAAKSSP